MRWAMHLTLCFWAAGGDVCHGWRRGEVRARALTPWGVRAAAGAPTHFLAQSQALALAETQTRVCVRHIQGDCAAATFFLAEQQELGDEASKFREAFFQEHGKTYGWLSAFMRERLHFDSIKSSAARAAYSQIKCAVRTAQGGIEKVKQQHGKKSMTCTAGVSARSRKRRKGGERSKKVRFSGKSSGRGS